MGDGFARAQPILRLTSMDALFGGFIRGNGSVALQVHSVVKDAQDFDGALCCCPVHQKMAPTTPVARNVERTKTRHDFVTGLGACDIGSVGKLANRLNERVPIDTRLPRAKILSRPFEDV